MSALLIRASDPPTILPRHLASAALNWVLRRDDSKYHRLVLWQLLHQLHTQPSVKEQTYGTFFKTRETSNKKLNVTAPQLFSVCFAGRQQRNHPSWTIGNQLTRARSRRSGNKREAPTPSVFPLTGRDSDGGCNNNLEGGLVIPARVAWLVFLSSELERWDLHQI